MTLAKSCIQLSGRDNASSGMSSPFHTTAVLRFVLAVHKRSILVVTLQLALTNV